MRTILEISDLKAGKFLKSVDPQGPQGYFKIEAVANQMAIISQQGNEFPVNSQSLQGFDTVLLDSSDVKAAIEAQELALQAERQGMLKNLPNEVQNFRK